MTTPILLDTPLWALILFFLFFSPVGIAGVVASVLTGLLCGRFMPNLSLRSCLVIGILTVFAVPLAGTGWFNFYDWGIEWVYPVVCVAVALAICWLWSLRAKLNRNSG